MCYYIATFVSSSLIVCALVSTSDLIDFFMISHHALLEFILGVARFGELDGEITRLVGLVAMFVSVSVRFGSFLGRSCSLFSVSSSSCGFASEGSCASVSDLTSSASESGFDISSLDRLPPPP